MSLTVRELIEALLDYDVETEVFLATDEEANTVKPVVDLSDGVDDESGTDEAVVILWP